MNMLSVLDGLLLLSAGLAFWWRAQLLGSRAKGWPGARLRVRLALEGAAVVLLIGGVVMLFGRGQPSLMRLCIDGGLAIYAAVFALNIQLQRTPRR